MQKALINSSEEIFNRFSTFIGNERLAHAYLFVGPQEVGKSTTAAKIAKLLNCEKNEKQNKKKFCDSCPACIKINSQNHPDVIVVDSGDGQTIKIAQVRELISKVQLRPFEARKKVMIIKDCDDLTPEGSNALLKTLEEPSKDTVLILTSAAEEKILPTIRSRCQVLRFSPLSKDKLAARLKNDYSIRQEASHFLAYFSEGCLGRAQRFVDDQFFDRKNDIIDNILFRKDNETYLKSLLADKEKTKQALDVLLSWFRDVLVIKSQGDSKYLIHADRRDDLSSLARVSFEQLEEIIREIVRALKLLEENLNVKISFVLLKERING